MASSSTSLDAATAERKARLARLANLKRKRPPTENDDGETAAADSADQQEGRTTDQHFSGRNYDVETRGPKLGFDSAPNEGQETLEARAKALASVVQEQQTKETKEDKPLDLFALQPKKPNWDLKRDLSRKMEILNQRTDNAIARLVRERLEGRKRDEKIAPIGSTDKSVDGEESDGAALGMTGADFVEGMKVMEREEEEERRREKEVDELDAA